jgi:hypothetical protein
VARFRLRFRGDREKVLVALARDVAPLTYGAVIIAADVSAVAATNCRRESF